MPGIVSILTPASTTALTTLDNAKLELNLSSTEDDAYLTQLINRTSAIVQGFVGRALGTQTVQETFREPAYGYNNNFYPIHRHSYSFTPLIVTFLPVNSITSIVEAGGIPLVANVDYEMEPQSGLLWRLSGSSRIPWSVSATVVTYISGYILPQDTTATRNMPWEIEDAVLSMIKSEYYARGQDPTIILEVTEGVGRTGYAPVASPKLSADIKSALAPYRSFVW